MQGRIMVDRNLKIDNKCNWILMRIETAKLLTSFIENKDCSISEFEQWVYTNSELEKELGTDNYTDLISLNFNDDSIRLNVKEIVDPILNYAELHKTEILELIQELIIKSRKPLDGIRQLNKWAEKGYLFRGSIEWIGNFGEQGKWIVYSLSDEMDKESQWNKLQKVDSYFINDLTMIKEKIETNRIIFTGEREVIKYYGEQFKYEEK